MPELLNEVETRVLGSLIEKQRTTPAYYPLTLNALASACNQLSNREPVVSFDERTVERGLESLREKKLVWVVTAAGGRVPKYEHRAQESYGVTDAEIAVLCLLMLRGPQTPGEIRSRSERLYAFPQLQDVEEALQALANRPIPLAAALPRQPGTRETRYAHLLEGDVDWAPLVGAAVSPAPTAGELGREEERLARLEELVSSLRQDLDMLQKQFDDFRRQFE
jgi:uncharacterized protein YceH (UPF0502 family)